MPSVEIEFTAFAYGGDALGRDQNGRVVFVPFAIPGERARIEILEERKRWARGRIVKLLKSSPDRVEPRCRHYGECGGCHYQHLSYTRQLDVKADLVRGQLQRLAGCTNPPVEPTIPSPSPWNSRNQLQFSLTPEGQLGFVRRSARRAADAGDSPRDVLPIAECHLPEGILGDLWPRLELGSIPTLERVAVRADTAGDTLLILHASGPPEVELETDQPGSVLWQWPGGIEVLAGSAHLQIEVHGYTFRVTGSAFFQVHTPLAGALVDLVLDGLKPQPGSVVFDLYAGVGLFSRFLAEAGARIVAVESDPWACEDYLVNLEPFEQVELYQAKVEQALPEIAEHPSTVLVDPPRTGLAPQVLEQLVQRTPGRLVYVSCDPATLARDTKRLLAAGYELKRVAPVDLFPQTYHIETVSTFIH